MGGTIRAKDCKIRPQRSAGRTMKDLNDLFFYAQVVGQRSSRRFAVTEVGQTYCAHCRAMLVEANAAEEAVALTQSEPDPGWSRAA